MNVVSKDILVIDDDKNFCKLLAVAFQQHGFQPYTAWDGQSGLNLYKEKRPRIVLLDVAMPGLNGFQVAAEIRRTEQDEQSEKPDSPTDHTLIVIMTAHARSFFVSQDFESGIDSYLTKPMLPDDIVEQVTNLMAQS